ncbi:MAG: MoaD/ThiS family protein [Dehalococcoidales bacterium]|nr:MoaD/ThiS family protein [Dehalococcoidales bacterium]
MAGSIRLRVKLGASLASLVGKSETELQLEGPLPLREVAERVGVSPNLVMLYVVNGALQTAEVCPADGDEVLLVPAVAGGALN